MKCDSKKKNILYRRHRTGVDLRKLDDPDQVKNYYLSNEQELNQVNHVALEDMVVELVMATATVSTKAVSYSEAVSRGANEETVATKN